MGGSGDRPAEIQSIYAAVGSVLYRSDDAGAAWQEVGAIPPYHAIMGSNQNVLLASDGYPCYQGGPDVSRWRSIDGGATWHHYLSGQNLKPLLAHPILPWFYAAGCDGPYRSPDLALTWQHQPDPIFGLLDLHFLDSADPAWNTLWGGGISEGGGARCWSAVTGGKSGRDPRLFRPNWAGSAACAPAVFPRATFMPRPCTVSSSRPITAAGGSITPKAWAMCWTSIAWPTVRTASFDIAEDPNDSGQRLWLGSVRGLYTRTPPPWPGRN